MMGTITEYFAFMNPHSSIHLQAKADKGNAVQWLIQQAEVRARYFSALAAGFSGGYLISVPPSDS